MTETVTVGPAFWLLATAIVLGALGVVLARNMVHSALSLGAVLLMVGGLYLNLNADLLAGFQVLIYVGAVVTLVLIAIMLIQNIAERTISQTNRRWAPGVLVAAATSALLIWVFSDATWPVREVEWDSAVQMRMLSAALIDNFVLPFEVASVMLLVALLGAVVIAQQVGRGEKGAGQ